MTREGRADYITWMNNKQESNMGAVPPDEDPVLSKGFPEFRSEIMGTVTQSVPGIAANWKRGKAAEQRAVEVVRTGIKTACEISVALSSSQEEAEAHMKDAGRLLGWDDKAAMGLYLSLRLQDIDALVEKAEKNGWAETMPGASPDQKQFVESKFSSLCAVLDTVSRDPDLVSLAGDARNWLFPDVVASEHRWESDKKGIVYQGTKGVSDLMKSQIGRSVSSKGADTVQESPKRITQALSRASRSIVGLRRDDSPSVGQK